MKINLSIDFDRPITADRTLVELQAILRRILPDWSSGLHVWRYREPKHEVAMSESSHLRDLAIEIGGTRGALFHQLVAEYGEGTQRESGSVEVRGANPSVILIIEFDSLITPRAGRIHRWGNSVSLQVRRKRIEGYDANRWAVEAFEELVDKLSPVYAHGESLDEFDAKNILRGELGGVEAVGVDVSKSLPGIYWLNFFGSLYCDFIGRGKLMGARAFATKPLDAGVFIRLGKGADEWNTAERRGVEARLLSEIGTEYFFSRDDPQRKTLAPTLFENSGEVEGHWGQTRVRRGQTRLFK